MRKRELIERDALNARGYDVRSESANHSSEQILEVLLDIRDLLANQKEV